MKIIHVMAEVQKFFNEEIKPVYKITSIQTMEQGWELVVEVIEESEYMVTSAKDELLGVYKVQINGDMEITAFERIALRPRGAMSLED